MWLPWPPAILMALMLWGGVWVGRRSLDRRVAGGRTFAAETALVLALYSLWRVAGTVSVWNVDGTLDRGGSIWDLQQALHMPSELRLQQVFLEHPIWIQASNGYYRDRRTCRPIIALLLSAFILHRERYPRVRNVLAVVTAACLVVQLVAVAPPRMYPGLGFVDSGHLYGQSVYTTVGTGVGDQLSAMPSLHIGWAVLVGLAAVLISSSRWRWLVLAHPVLTFVVVAATANHWWLDGVVAVVILALAASAEDRVRTRLATCVVRRQATWPEGAGTRHRTADRTGHRLHLTPVAGRFSAQVTDRMASMSSTKARRPSTATVSHAPRTSRPKTVDRRASRRPRGSGHPEPTR